jgi:preprotein translocase subunit YajC
VNDLTATQNTVNSVLNVPISQVQSNLQQLLVGTTSTASVVAQGGIQGIVASQLNNQTQVITQAANNMETEFTSVLSSFETQATEAVTVLQAGAATAQAAGNLLKATAAKFAWQASVAPNPAVTGDTITLTTAGLAGKVPVITIYTWDNKIVVKDFPLTQTTPGVYTYTFVGDSRFTPGKSYTYTITEATSDAFLTGSGSVESMGLTSIAGLASSAPTAAQAAENAVTEIQKVEAILGSSNNSNIIASLRSLQASVNALPETQAAQSGASAMGNTINEISDRLQKLGGNEGLDLKGIFEKAMSESPTIKDMRLKTEEINAAIELLRSLFEAKMGGKDAPVISTSVQSGSIVFQIVAANPSKSKTQKVPVKFYLPIEAKAKDIMDNGGLDLEYDSDKSRYYVYKDEVELKPTEIKVFKVEVQDVWVINKDELDDIRQRVETILTKLADTGYFIRAKGIADIINRRLAYIAASQSDEGMSRERHIGIYRENLGTLALIKEDVAKMERILVTAGGPPAPEMLAKTKIKGEEPSQTMTWIMIFVIIVFVGFLAAAFYFLYHGQTRLGKEELLSAKRAAFPENEGPKTEEPKKEGPSPENNKDSSPS